MEVDVPRGKYVLAVSGGVDSMVLLDVLAKKPNLKLFVAHFDHGIRHGSHQDEELVRSRSKQLKLPFEAGYGRLGRKASEADARKARYDFLRFLSKKNRTDAIITAHHQDDMIETAVINLLRGTGRHGLSAIVNNSQILRPMLNTPKAEIISYAHKQGLVWNEDPTNQSTGYLRNYLRREILAGMSNDERAKFIKNIDKVAKINKEIDYEIATLSHKLSDGSSINRLKYSSLPIEVASEVLAAWLRRNGLKEFERDTINRLDLALRVAKPTKSYPINGNSVIKLAAASASIGKVSQ